MTVVRLLTFFLNERASVRGSKVPHRHGRKKGDSPAWSPCWLSMLPSPHAHSFLMKLLKWAVTSSSPERRWQASVTIVLQHHPLRKPMYQVFS